MGISTNILIFGVSPISVETESYLIVFTSLNYFIGTYIVYTRISCVYIHFVLLLVEQVYVIHYL